LDLVIPRGQELHGFSSQSVRYLLERRIRLILKQSTSRLGALSLRFPFAVVRCIDDIFHEVLANVVPALRFGRTRVIGHVVPREHETVEDGDVVPLDEHVVEIRVRVLLYAGERHPLVAVPEEPVPEFVSGLVDRQGVESQDPRVLAESLDTEESRARQRYREAQQEQGRPPMHL